MGSIRSTRPVRTIRAAIVLFAAGVVLAACVPPTPPGPPPDPILTCESLTGSVSYDPPALGPIESTVTALPGTGFDDCTDHSGGSITSAALTGSVLLTGVCGGGTPGDLWGTGKGKILWNTGGTSHWDAVVYRGTTSQLRVELTFTAGRWIDATASIDLNVLTSDGDCTNVPVTEATIRSSTPFVLHPG